MEEGNGLAHCQGVHSSAYSGNQGGFGEMHNETLLGPKGYDHHKVASGIVGAD